LDKEIGRLVAGSPCSHPLPTEGKGWGTQLVLFAHAQTVRIAGYKNDFAAGFLAISTVTGLLLRA
jgi:hypothetical protein